ncbi:ankyrin repeat domain-containing protein, partial [Ralstonia pseudosolanacearum]
RQPAAPAGMRPAAPVAPDVPAPMPAPLAPGSAIDRDATSGLPGSLSDQKTVPPPDLRGN